MSLDDTVNEYYFSSVTDSFTCWTYGDVASWKLVFLYELDCSINNPDWDWDPCKIKFVALSIR